MNLKEKKENMALISKSVFNLKNSELATDRRKNGTLPVIGDGDLNAKIMFVGEAPGKNEAERGLPFCGRAGDILNELLKSIKLPRNKVYITNIVKDRPPKNRDPLPEEIKKYVPFLDRQIDIIRPKIIATLGRFSSVYIMDRFGLEDKIKPISKMHGIPYTANTEFGKVIILPLYHPSASIYNQSLKQTLFKDFKKIDKLRT